MGFRRCPAAKRHICSEAQVLRGIFWNAGRFPFWYLRKRTFYLFCTMWNRPEIKGCRCSRVIYKGITVLAAQQEKHRSERGCKNIVRDNMLPGFVFTYSAGIVPFHSITTHHNVCRFLTYGNAEGCACVEATLTLFSGYFVIEGSSPAHRKSKQVPK